MRKKMRFREIGLLLSVVLLLSSCSVPKVALGHLDQLRTENRQKIVGLSVGMTKQKVIDIMGQNCATDSYANHEKVTVCNPYKSEILYSKDKTFEVLYYYVEKKQETKVDSWGWSQPVSINDDELTPLVFDNGILVGWGRNFLQDNINKYEFRIR